MSLKKAFKDALDACYDAQTMFFTDRDGVLVMSVGEETRGRQQVIACHQNSIEQVKKFDMGGHKSSVFFYGQSQVIISTMGHLTLFIIAPENANTGLLLRQREKLLPLAKAIEIAIPAVTIDREALEDNKAWNTTAPSSRPFPEVCSIPTIPREEDMELS